MFLNTKTNSIKYYKSSIQNRTMTIIRSQGLVLKSKNTCRIEMYADDNHSHSAGNIQNAMILTTQINNNNTILTTQKTMPTKLAVILII